MSRETGWYRTRRGKAWEFSYYESCSKLQSAKWWINALGHSEKDDYFDEIDETPVNPVPADESDFEVMKSMFSGFDFFTMQKPSSIPESNDVYDYIFFGEAPINGITHDDAITLYKFIEFENGKLASI